MYRHWQRGEYLFGVRSNFLHDTPSLYGARERPEYGFEEEQAKADYQSLKRFMKASPWPNDVTTMTALLCLEGVTVRRTALSCLEDVKVHATAPKYLKEISLTQIAPYCPKIFRFRVLLLHRTSFVVSYDY